MPTPVKFLDDETFQRLEKYRRENRLSMVNAYGKCAMWFVPWIFDPKVGQDVLGIDRMLAAIERKAGAYLSKHYLTTWARLRPPIEVLTPNGECWCPDAISSNGTGWAITGDVPLITASPSIVVDGYHGFLQNGVFSDDIEGRGVTGIAKR